MVVTIEKLAQRLRSGELSSTTLVEQSIERAEASSAVFIEQQADRARAQAARIDAARSRWESLPDCAGIPITLKDLFDIAGEVTRAGSRVLARQPPARLDADVVTNLRKAGFIILGRVNMSEFAFSGIGVNPHYGTPLCVWDRAVQRLPGGSSSGSGVSVAEGIVAGSIGSDTAGSSRIPAAFNGVVGYKPSFRRFSLEGVYPLSPTTDAPGPLASSVRGCHILAHAMHGLRDIQPLAVRRVSTMRLFLPQAQVMEGLDGAVAEAFGAAVERLRELGCTIETHPMPALDGLGGLFQQSPLAVYEAWQAHRERLAHSAAEYDPFVSWRIGGGESISDAQYRQTLLQRQSYIEEVERALHAF